MQLAVPSIISNITVPLLGLVDVAIVGHIGDAAYIGAIAVGSMLFNVIYWLFGFLRMGTSGMTSQALGRRDFSEVVRLLIRSLGIGVGIGLLFFILQRWIIGCGLWAMSPEADVVELARRYCYVCIWGAPAVLGLYGFTGWYIGMQNTRIPMVVSLSQNVVNIVASLVLVFVCRMTVEGVALGTVIAQWWGFLMACVLYRIYYRRLGKYDYRQHLFASEPLKRFFSLNRDIFLRTVCLVAVNLFFTAAGSRESTLVLAVNTLLMTLFTIFSYFMDGFAYAAEALSGKYYGAGNREAFREVVKRTMGFGVVVAILFTLLYIVGGENFLSLLTSDRQVVAAAVEDDTDADAPADVYEDDVFQSLADTFQIFTVSHAAGIVVDAERQVESFGQRFCQRHCRAGEVIIGTTCFRVHSSTDTHASLLDLASFDA